MKAVAVPRGDCPICDTAENVIAALTQPQLGPQTFFQDVVDMAGVQLPQLKVRVKVVAMTPMLCTECGLGFFVVNDVKDGTGDVKIQANPAASNPMLQ